MTTSGSSSPSSGRADHVPKERRVVNDLLLLRRPAVARRPRIAVGRRPVDPVMHVGNMLLLSRLLLVMVLLPSLLLL